MTEDGRDKRVPSASDTRPIEQPGLRLIDGRYQLHERLGEGGMGAVYRATHVLMDKPVAVKLIHAELAQIPEVAKRFEREARSASRLSDPHCITVTDFGRTKDDNTLFLVMELLTGDSLADRLDTTGTLPVEKALTITRQILQALVHAHSAGVVHRDLKPENVMLTSHGDEVDFAKVFDFGIAKLATGTDPNENLTRAGLIVGTPAYLSPEQALGEPADHRADLYAVGVMLYEMLTGDKPFYGESAMDIISSHISSPVPSLQPATVYPRGVQAIIDRAMAKRPADRFPAAAAFIEALDAIDPDEVQQSPHALFTPRALATRVRPAVVRTNHLLKGASSAVQSYLKGLAPPHRRLIKGLTAVIGLALVIGIFAALIQEDNTFDAPVPVAVVEAPGVDEESIKAIFSKAEAEIKAGLPQKAIATLKPALEQSPEQPIGHLLIGHAAFLAENRTAAMASYSKALSYDPSLVRDVRLGTYLEEGLKWAGSRKQAAQLLVDYGGEKGVAILASRANTAQASGDERNVARQALIAAGKEDTIDWLASLTADFNEYKTCKKQKKIIAQMEQTGDPRFLPLLEENRVLPAQKKSRRGLINKLKRVFKRGRRQNKEEEKRLKCISPDVRRAIKTLTAIQKRTKSHP
ncbi:MAG: protein kinase [Myxococcota bacterium]|nr:protein kinase [Myxococcota bacterium]